MVQLSFCWSSTHVLFWIIGPPYVCVCGGGGCLPNVHFRWCRLQGSNTCRDNPYNKYRRPNHVGHRDPLKLIVHNISKNANFYLLILLIAFFRGLSKAPESKFLSVGKNYVPRYTPLKRGMMYITMSLLCTSFDINITIIQNSTVMEYLRHIKYDV